MQTKTFYVADGVSALSAGAFSEKRTIRLTEAEATYDMALGRLTPKKPKTSVSKNPEDAEGDD